VKILKIITIFCLILAIYVFDLFLLTFEPYKTIDNSIYILYIYKAY